MTDWKRPPQSPNCVTIFGAGVAGLTAAHELVERGFRVQIWEKEGDPRYPHRGPDIGGMARTQWSRIGWKSEQKLDITPEEEKAKEEKPKRAGSTTTAEASAQASLDPIEREIAKFRASHAQSIKHLHQKLVFLRQEDKGSWYLQELTDDDVELSKQANAKERALVALETGTHFILRIRDYETGTTKDDEELLDRALGGLKAIFGEARVIHAPASTEFDLKIDDNTTRKVLIRSGTSNFGTNVSAHLEYFEGEAFKRGDSYFALKRAWTRGELRVLGANAESDEDAVLKQFLDVLSENEHIDYVYVETSDRDGHRLTTDEKRDRANKVHEGLAAALEKRRLTLKTDPRSEAIGTGGRSPLLYTLEFANRRPVKFEIVVLDEFPSDVPPQAHLYTSFRVREHWLPGEHGYRLFPNCYRHLFDTMKRTPILDTIEKSPFALEQERAAGVPEPEPLRYVETGRTAFDNIRPTNSHLLAFENGAGPSVLSRSKLKSIDEMRELFHVIFAPVKAGGFEIGEGDSIRLTLKMLQYIISSPARRAQYEEISWWDFVDGDSYGPRLGKFLEVWPEALVAMDAHNADARSHGDSLIQVTLDQLRDGGFRDGTLRGPVSEAWFAPWRRYLEAQGVEFLHGELKGFVVEEVAKKRTVLPWVDCFEPRYPMEPENRTPLLMPGYFVVAVSADQAAALSLSYLRTVDQDLHAPAELSDFAKAARFDTADRDEARPDSDFRHFAGLQFYFAEDVFWAEGHVYYPQSPWGLSSVSQARFWDEKTDWEHGFRGILSVIIATWDEPGELIKKAAWNCSPEELAAEVWHQIKQGVERTRPVSASARRRAALPSERHRAERFHLDESLVDGRLPEPLHWRLDEKLEWNEKTKAYTNHAPFHIAKPAKYKERPGSLEPRGYTVENGFVMCGMHMQTQFRLPTMEAANESARHAVNAILKHAHEGQTTPPLRSTLCETWDPEMFEFDSMMIDLQSLKDIDHLLVQRGLPHVLEILEADKWARRLVEEVGVWDIKTFTRLLVDLASKVSGEVKRGY